MLQRIHQSKQTGPRMRRLNLVHLRLASLLSVASAFAEADTSQLPPPADRVVDFAADIRPIFAQNCLRCHGAERPKARFRLASREAALKGGDNGVDIIAGDSARSPLIHFVARLDADIVMPPEGKGDPLTSEQVALLRAWIDQGAQWSGVETNLEWKVTLAPAAGFVTVSGNAAKFREQWWQREGGRGGVESFEAEQRLSPDTKFALSGRALTDDYRADLILKKEELGFARIGFEQFRKYDSDTGGYFPAFSRPTYSLNRDLHLDIGRAWLDLGLTLPDWPRIVLGYEYQYRKGEKATLEWGAVGTSVPNDPATDARNIFPARKAIDERTHVLKLDVDYERGGWRVEDSFRGEWTELQTRHEDVNSLVLGAPDSLLVDSGREGWHSFQGANTMRVERQFKDWFFTSAGYLYSHLSADASFNWDTSGPDGALISGVYQSVSDSSQRILLERESHVGNLNLLFGPWQGGTFSLGAQSEWTRQNGTLIGTEKYTVAPPFNIFLPDFTLPNNGSSGIDRAVVDETAALRINRLPFTTLFAEARLTQERINHREDVAGHQILHRDSDVRGDGWDVRTGFESSPFTRLKFGSHFRWRNKSTTFDDGFADDGLSDPINGYPTFISARDSTTQEVESRLTVRPYRWLRTTFTHRLVATDTRVTTEPAVNEADPSQQVSPGGRVFSGNYDAQIFSLNCLFTPWRRLDWFTTVSYQDVSSISLHANSSAVVPYRGGVWSVICNGRYGLTEKSDLTAGYTFSAADFRQNNFADGLPVGMRYDLHGLQAAVVSRCTKNLTTKLQYGFYHYAEPSSGGANDYTAHAVFVSLNLRLH